MPRLTNVDEFNTTAGDPRQTFRERLMKRFASHEWVRVINPDDERYMWQYLPSHKEEFEFTADPMKITTRGAPEAYYLDPGKSEVIVGENAYIMIEGLYKKLVSKKVIAKTPTVAPGYARAFNWTDPNQQDLFIDMIYLGKERPQFDGRDEGAPEAPKTPREEIVNEAIEADKPKVGRPRKAV